MFYLDNCLALPKLKNSRWSTADISQMTMSDIYDQFIEAYFGIHFNISSVNQPTFWVSLSTIKAKGFSMNLGLTLQNYLAGLASSTPIPHDSSTMPAVTITNAEFADAWQSGYDIERIPYYGPIDAPQPLGIKTDLLFTRIGTDYNLFATNCLVTVNGLFHYSRLEANNVGVRVVGGGKSVDICGQNRVGVYSFLEVGGIQIIPITEDMMFKPDVLMTNSSETYINLGVDLTGKSVMMVIGGYLHINDETYQVVGKEMGSVKVMVKNIELIKRLFESRQFIDISSLNLSVNPNNAEAIATADMLSDDVIKAYLTLSQSFAVVVNTPSLYRQKNQAECAKLPGIYYYPTQPTFPLTLTTGIVAEYVSHREDDVWVMSVVNNLKNNYQFTTTNYLSMPWVIPDLIYEAPFDWAIGDLLEVGTETITNVNPV